MNEALVGGIKPLSISLTKKCTDTCTEIENRTEIENSVEKELTFLTF